MPKVVREEVDPNIGYIRPISVISNSANDRVRASANSVANVSTILRSVDNNGVATYYRYDHHTNDWSIITSSAAEAIQKVQDKNKQTTPWTSTKVFGEWWPGGRPSSSGGSNIR